MSPNNSNLKDFMNCFSSNNLIKQLTRFKSVSSTCINLIIPNQKRLLDRRQRGPIRSVLLVIIGWLVGNAIFSEMALRIFLIFRMRLGDCKGRKVTYPNFWKNLLIWRYSRKSLRISPKSDILIFFSKAAAKIPEVSTKYDLQFKWNLFSEKFAISIYSASKSSKNCPNWGFWPFSQLCIVSFPWFCTQW